MRNLMTSAFLLAIVTVLAMLCAGCGSGKVSGQSVPAAESTAVTASAASETETPSAEAASETEPASAEAASESGAASGAETASEADTEAEAETQTGSESSEDRQMLLNYFRRTVGTPMEMPFYELVIYTYDAEHLLLEQYTEGGTPYEYVKAYLIPEEAYEEVLKIIRAREMQNWNDLPGGGITGAMYVCRFCLDGEYYRVSSDHMPDDGMNAFHEVDSAMASYIREDRLLYERYVNGEPPELSTPIVKDRDELLSYVQTEELNTENCEDYFTLSSGMGPDREDGSTGTNVLYYVLLYCRPGYFPCSDTRLTFTFAAKDRDGKVSAQEGTADSTTAWYYDHFDDCLRSRPVETETFTTFDDLKMQTAEGLVATFEIPEDLLFEDEYGRFFYFGDPYTKYYLNGCTGHVVMNAGVPGGMAAGGAFGGVPADSGYMNGQELWFQKILWDGRSPD